MQFSVVFGTLATAAVALAQSTLTVNTPTSLVECQPSDLSWSGGVAPYFVSIIPGGQSSAAALESFPSQTGTSYTWTVDIASGTSVTVQIRDSDGTLNYSQAVTIQAGTSTSCTTSSAAGASSGASSGTAAAAGTSSTGAASSVASVAASATSKAASAASSAASQASSAVASASSAASSKSSSSGAEKVGAGLFTVVAGALLAVLA